VLNVLETYRKWAITTFGERVKNRASRYDHRQRMVEKQVPGAGVVYSIYDNRDRVVLTQDANQRLGNKWIFTKYDVLNRPVSSGEYVNTDSTTRESIQSLVNSYYENLTASQRWYETTMATTGNVHGYDNASFPQVGSEIDYLTVTYYDNYDWNNDVAYAYVKPSTDCITTNDSYCYEDVEFTRVKGQVTGGKVKNLDTDQWLKSMSYYDDRYRTIQTVVQNQKGGIDRSSNLYDFVGKALESKKVHTDGTNTNEIKKGFEYDHAGRLMEVKHQLNAEPEITLLSNSYNEIGELIEKNIHSTDGTNFEQSIDYRYNIRGWLTSINDAALSDGESDMFGMELAYNTPMNNLNPTLAYNGNISAMKWSGDTGQLGYGYTYDAMNRLKSADYQLVGVGDTNNFDVIIGDATTSGFDLNGNITSLTRYDQNGIMDQLAYNYGTGLDQSNQLLSVTDAGDITEGFRDGNTTGDDYDYDENGNTSQDLNKGITSIEYNHLNLPSKVTKDDGQYIKYLYDAAGIKLAQEVYNTSNTLVKRTDYIGEFIYENDTLALIQHEEGRLVPDPIDGSMTYEYRLSDHLGNTRMMFTTEPKTIDFKMTYESDATDADSVYFMNVNIASIKDFNSTTGNVNYAGSQILYSSPNSQVGSILAIPVGKGDQITATVNAKYFTAPANGSVGATSIATSLINAFTSGVEGVTEGGTNTINGSFGGGSLIGTAGFAYEDANAPHAFLNMMFLPESESINLVNGSTFAYDQIADGSTEAIIDGISQNAFDVLTIEDFEATQSGYILVYVSNEGSLTDVFFDDISVTVNESKIIQKADYFPFGLMQAGGYIRTTAKENNFLYNNFEIQTALEWDVYDYTNRHYDPATGRFLQIDPLADLMRRHSTYSYAFNNPLRFIDPDGMMPEDTNKKTVTSSNNTDVISETTTSTTSSVRTVKKGTDEFNQLLGKSTISGKNGIGDEITVRETSTTTVQTDVSVEYDDNGDEVSRSESATTTTSSTYSAEVSDQYGGTAGGFTNNTAPTSSSTTAEVSSGLSGLVSEAVGYRSDYGVSITNRSENAAKALKQREGLRNFDRNATATGLGLSPLIRYASPASIAFTAATKLIQASGNYRYKQLKSQAGTDSCNNCTKTY